MFQPMVGFYSHLGSRFVSGLGHDRIETHADFEPNLADFRLRISQVHKGQVFEVKK
jgi:hypothetical protein